MLVLFLRSKWGGRATPDSIGYRLVRSFRHQVIASIYDSYTAAIPIIATPQAGSGARRFATPQADEPSWRLISERPAHLVPPGFNTWDEVIEAALAKLLLEIETEADGKLQAFTWGAFSRTAIKHALASAVPVLGLLLDPPDEPLAGDIYQPRVSGPGFGAAERFRRAGTRRKRRFSHADRPERAPAVALLQFWA